MSAREALQRQLTSGPDDRLLAIIKTRLTGEEQELFINEYARYISADPAAFVINFDFAYEWLGFSRKDNAKTKLVNTLIKDVDYRILLLPVQEQNGTQDPRGGHNKETIMLTVNGFESFCLLANTPKAKRVRSYYIAIKNIVFEHTRTVLADMEFAKAYSRHQALVASHDKVPVVYLGLVTINGVQYVKLGETLDLRTRAGMLRTEYNNTFVIIEVVPCERSQQYEQWLLKNSELSPYRCIVTIDGVAKQELLILKDGGLTKEHASKVVRDHVSLFSSAQQIALDMKRLQVEIEQLRLQADQARLNTVATLATTTSHTPDDILRMVTPPAVTTLPEAPQVDPPAQAQAHVQGLNDSTQAVQQYSLEGVLVSVSDSIRDAARKIPGATAYSIITAANENYEYKGFRWLTVDRDTRYETRALPPQNNTNAKVNRMVTIAQVDPTSKRVLKTFPNLEVAAAAVGLRSAASLTNGIQNSATSKGFLWMRYDDCAPEARAAFEAAGGVVVPPQPRVSGKTLNQLDPVSGVLIKSFATFQEACLALQGSHKSFHTAVQKNTVYKGFKWAQPVPVVP